MAAWWDEKKELLLLTSEELESLPIGTKLGCIDGGTYTLGTDYIDKDTRGGLTVYGVKSGHPLWTRQMAKDLMVRLDGVTDPVAMALSEAARKDEEHRASKWASGT